MDDNQTQQYTHGSLPQPVLGDVGASAHPASNNLQQTQESASGSQPASQLSPAVSSAAPAAASPAPAPIADTDIIDPVWVTKINQLMQQYVSDPRKLSHEFEKIKAQYIAGRYGKEIRVSSDKETA